MEPYCYSQEGSGTRRREKFSIFQLFSFASNFFPFSYPEEKEEKEKEIVLSVPLLRNAVDPLVVRKGFCVPSAHKRLPKIGKGKK